MTLWVVLFATQVAMLAVAGTSAWMGIGTRLVS
jgi:hypothetical protein